MKINTRIILLALFGLTCVNILRANADDSTKLQQLKFEMIKNTVIFYATDDSLLKGKQIAGCSNDATIEQLIDHTKSLPGVNDKIKMFNNMAVANAKDLIRLKEIILNEVAGKGKEYRVNRPDYDKFKSSLDKASEEVQSEEPISTTKLDTHKVIVPVAQEQVIPVEQSVFSGLTIWNCIAIILSLIAVVSGYIFSRNVKEKKGTSSATSRNHNNSRDNDNNNFLYEQLKSKQQVLEDRVGSMELQLKKLIFAEEGKKSQERTVTDITGGMQPVNVIKYAKTADGNAFDVSTLSDRQDNKKIYELTIYEAGKGTFKITANREAQLFALEDPNNYLRGACDYSSLPSSYNSTITTTSPGKIELNGSKWSIIKPAEIDFS